MIMRVIRREEILLNIVIQDDIFHQIESKMSAGHEWDDDTPKDDVGQDNSPGTSLLRISRHKKKKT